MYLQTARGSYAHTSRQELHDEVEVDGVLEGVVHLHHPGVVRLHQDVPLCPGMGNLWGGGGEEEEGEEEEEIEREEGRKKHEKEIGEGGRSREKGKE